MKHYHPSLLAAACVACAFTANAQNEEAPILTFHTTVYEDAGAANHFSIFLGSTTDTYIEVDSGFGPTEVEIKPAYFDQVNKEMVATAVPITVSAEGVVKIYGNPQKIEYVNLSYSGITEIEWSQLTNVLDVAVDHNNLRSLDLSNKPRLETLDISYNEFTPTTPCVIGDHPHLGILDMTLTDYVDPNFDMTKYPELLSLLCGHSYNINYLDPTQCPELRQLSATCTDISTLDVSQNPELMYLDVSNTKMTSLDVTQNPRLQMLGLGNTGNYNSAYKFSEIDLSNNPLLFSLGLDSNNFTELDLSNQDKLRELSCAHNFLTELEVGSNPLGILWCSYNSMTFNTLPQPPNYCDFTYNKQAAFACAPGPYDAGQKLDFAWAVFNDYSETTCDLVYAYDGAPVPQSAYSFEDGVITILEPINAEVMAVFNNSMYYMYPQYSQSFYVSDKADVEERSLSAFGNVCEYYSLDGVKVENPVPGQVYVVHNNGKIYKTVVK